MKWGEYSNDVQFILHWNDVSRNSLAHNKLRPPSEPTSPTIVQQQVLNSTAEASTEKSKDLVKSFTFR